MDFPCKNCVHYDQQHKNVKGARVDNWFGHCAAQSVYPNQQLEGQLFPIGVKRADKGSLGKMVIVQPEEVVKGCTSGVRK